MIGSLSRGAAGAERRGGSRGWPVPSTGDPIVEISRRGVGPCARGAAGAERGGELRGWPVPSPGRSNRGNLTVVGGDRAEEETDEEDENHRLMAAAHHCSHPRLCPGTLLISDLLVMLYCFDISYEASCLLYLNVQ